MEDQVDGQKKPKTCQCIMTGYYDSERFRDFDEPPSR